MNSIFRTSETQEKYSAYQAAGHLAGDCVLCGAPSLREFKHWRVISNRFPYDKIAKTHDMIIPKRHVTEPELNAEEMEELREIKEGNLHKEYDFIIEATHRMKTIPAHFHLHLIVARA